MKHSGISLTIGNEMFNSIWCAKDDVMNNDELEIGSMYSSIFGVKLDRKIPFH